MRVLIAADSLKGCLPSMAAGEALKEGILRAIPEAVIQVCPLADGGEGTTEALTFGLGFAFRTFLGGELEPGAQIVMEAVDLEDHIREADIIITGEGRTDAQTAMGKAPAAVSELAKKHEKPVIVFCGSKGPGAEDCYKKGIDAIIPILREPCSLAEAMDPENARRNLSEAAEQVFRVIGTIKSL